MISKQEALLVHFSGLTGIWKGGPYSSVVFHDPMGNPISEHDDHTVVWTLRDFLV